MTSGLVRALGRAALILTASAGTFALSQEPPPPAPGTETPPPPSTEPTPPGPPADGGAPPATPPAGGGATPARELDTTSPEALALKELLHVDANYAKDGTVDITYSFDDEGQLVDWQNQGFDRCDVYGGNLTLGAGSQGQGLIQHCLELQAPYEVVIKCKLEWVTSRSDLVFLFGKGGGRFGNAFVERLSRGWKPLGRIEPARDRFSGARDVTIRYVAAGDEVTVWMNNVQLGTTDKLRRKLDGKVGMWMTDARLVIDEVQLKGHIDASKL